MAVSANSATNSSHHSRLALKPNRRHRGHWGHSSLGAMLSPDCTREVQQVSADVPSVPRHCGSPRNVVAKTGPLPGYEVRAHNLSRGSRQTRDNDLQGLCSVTVFQGLPAQPHTSRALLERGV